MKMRIVDGIEVETGSGNVFADLGLPDADRLKIKSGLVIEIVKAVERLDLSQAEAAERIGLTQSNVSALLRGDFSNFQSASSWTAGTGSAMTSKFASSRQLRRPRPRSLPAGDSVRARGHQHHRHHAARGGRLACRRLIAPDRRLRQFR